jgi:ubiquinone/menaquinone biosynthesis C-methylase UbiE
LFCNHVSCLISALMDSMVCAHSNLRDIDDLLREMLRVLKTGGVYFVVSHASPTRRLKYFQKIFGSAMDIQISKVGTSNKNLMFPCR